MLASDLTPDPRQLAYAARRAAWERDVWAAIAARIQAGIETDAKKEAKDAD